MEIDSYFRLLISSIENDSPLKISRTEGKSFPCRRRTFMQVNGERELSQEFGSKEMRGRDLFASVVFVEGMLIVGALGLAWMGLYDRNQPLNLEWLSEKWVLATLWGVVATVPCLVLLFAMQYGSSPRMKQLADLVKFRVVPLFDAMPIWKLLIIAVMAGLGEELLFRWALQGGIEYLMGESYGRWLALLVASLAFGICHYLSATYAVLAAGIGCYLGLLMILTGSWLTPTVTHALYDFVALLYLTNRLPIKFSVN